MEKLPKAKNEELDRKGVGFKNEKEKMLRGNLKKKGFGLKCLSSTLRRSKT